MSAPYEWLWMQQTFGIGTARAHRALEQYGRPDELLALTPARLAMDKGLTPAEKAAISSPDFAAAKEKFAQAEALGFAVITPDSPEYPQQLRNIHSIPLVLYAKGDLSLLAEPYPVAMVGTREPDTAGIRAAKKIAAEVAGNGGVVVSGLAHGIDALCHEAALAVGGKTIAVLAAGPDSDYPKLNSELREKIEQRGLVLTEFPVGSTVRPYSFPPRNRIVSGLSLATVVVQAALKSGSLITAGLALEQNRDVFVVCGDPFSQKTKGCSALLRDGAEPVPFDEYTEPSGRELLRRYEAIYEIPLSPVADTDAILAAASITRSTAAPAAAPKRPRQKKSAEPKPALAPKSESTPAPPTPEPELDTLSPQQRDIYAACAVEIGFDELCEKTALATPVILAALTQLEIFGLIEELPGRRFRRAR